MKEEFTLKPGDIYYPINGKPYQIITIACDVSTGKSMVVYQLLYNDFKVYVQFLDEFIKEKELEAENHDLNKKERQYGNIVDDVQKGKEDRNENRNDYRRNDIKDNNCMFEKVNIQDVNFSDISNNDINKNEVNENEANRVLMEFLDATSCYKKLNVLSGNRKHINDRVINNMAVSLDCTINEGPIDYRISELITCLQAMIRFEDRRLR